MIRFLLILAICLLLAAGSYAQTVSPTPDRSRPVTVTQGFVDDASKAFALVVELRDSLQKEKELNEAKGVTNAAKDAQIVALNGLIAIFERKDVIYQSLLDLRDQAFAVYEKVIKIQADMIDRMAKQLSKGKSGWDKFVGVLKTVATIVLGVAIGGSGL